MFNIYLSGSITGLKSKDEVLYRHQMKEKLEDKKQMYRYKYKVSVFNPVEYFNYLDEVMYQSEKQVMRYELNKLRTSDLVIVDFKNPNSLGTMAELAIAYELKKPIIGFNKDHNKLHPWQEEMCDVMFDKLTDLIDYIIEFYLI